MTPNRDLCASPAFSLGLPQQVGGVWLKPLQTCHWALWLAARSLAAQGRLKAEALRTPAPDAEAAAVLRLLLRESMGTVLADSFSPDSPDLPQILQLICLQAGSSLPPPDANPALLQPRPSADSAAEDADPPRFEELVAAVAANTGQSMQELWHMPIRQFEALRRAVDRSLRHRLLLQAALAGRLKKDVPIPGWQLEPTGELPHGWHKL